MPDNDQTNRIDLSRRKILGSLGAIGVAGAGAGFGTTAFFSDQEQFANNQLVAGELDLKVGWEEHYSDWSEDEAEHAHMEDGELVIDDREGYMEATLQEQFPDKETKKQLDEGTADPCDVLGDMPDDLSRPLIELTDVKPGDFGEVTFDFALCDNPGFLWLTGGLVDADENGTTEPEAEDADELDPSESDPANLFDNEGDESNEPNTDPDDTTQERVELLDALQITIWHDDNCDNINDDAEEEIFSGSLREGLVRLSGEVGLPIDSPSVEKNLDPSTDGPATGGVGSNRGCFEPETRHCVGFTWELPVDHANELQTDSVIFDLGFYTEQCRHNDGSGMAAEDGFPMDVATTFLDKVDVPPEANVFFAGEVEPGLIMQEASGPTRLEVPDLSSRYYVFFINDHPGLGFTHSVRYAWLETESGEFDVVDARWQPFLFRDGDRVFFRFTEGAVVDGRNFSFGNRVRLLQDANTPDVSSKGSWDDLPEEYPVGSAGPPGNPSPRVEDGAESVLWNTNCHALVIDGGDNLADDRDSDDDDDEPDMEMASDMAEDANIVADWLRSKGFNVVRRSQYWGNDLPSFANPADLEQYTNPQRGVQNEVKVLLEMYARVFEICCNNIPQPGGGTEGDTMKNPEICFFIYIQSHGDGSGFEIWSADGTQVFSISYADLMSWLCEFPDCVRFTVFINACNSVGAENAVQNTTDDDDNNWFMVDGGNKTNRLITMNGWTEMLPDSVINGFLGEAYDDNGDPRNEENVEYDDSSLGDRISSMDDWTSEEARDDDQESPSVFPEPENLDNVSLPDCLTFEDGQQTETGTGQ